MNLREKLKILSSCKFVDSLCLCLRKTGGDDYLAFYGGTTEQDLYYLQDFACVFLPKEAKQKLSAAASMTTATNMNASYAPGQARLNAFQRYELQQKSLESEKRPFGMQRKKSSVIEFPLDPAVEERIKQVLSNRTNRKFFIDVMVAQREPITGNPKIRLQTKLFSYLCDYLAKLLDGIAIHFYEDNSILGILDERDFELVWCFLPLLNKYYTIVRIL